MNRKLITVEGNIGSGKTSLAEKLAADLDANSILESFADNPFLEKFYQAPEAHAFSVELFFMAERYEQLKQLLDTPDLFRGTTVSDYLFAKTLLFASINLNKEELALYRRIFNQLYPSLPKPNLLLYIDAPIEQVQQNIKKRGRPYEQNIPDSYLQKVHHAYIDFLKQMAGEWAIVLLDASEGDFMEDETAYLKILNIAQQDHSKGLQLIKL